MFDETRPARRAIRLPIRPARWWAVAGVAGLLLAGALASSANLAVLTGLSVPTGPVRITTWLHFLGYATLGALFCAALHAGAFARSLGASRTFLSAFAVVAGYGLAVELLHAVVPHRTFSLLDVAANVLGAFAGSALVWTVASLLYLRARTARPVRPS
ncbi:VanZ family protein [Halalkalicoccus sp. NIPERK01]|uniref:VanZ family protein n=1 Tax=Halalkalicoccus sp. NIPERK01 TaxID=3053469 RepID=UPI00256E9F75|nr:VanZ family protein [Halalkalicoccus sp. NIPERK01]MDL5362024.1 VanZ family protein [Halalkalicoccus sp. NIPERK01]